MTEEKFWGKKTKEKTIIDSGKFGIFVYALTDHKNNIFYVGKGGGTGEGNKRPEHHLSDAKKNPDSKSKKHKAHLLHLEQKRRCWIADFEEKY